MAVTLQFALQYAYCMIWAYMMRCTQNKYTIFFIDLSLLGRVRSGHKSTDMLRVGSGQEHLGSGRVGYKKVTHVQLWSGTPSRLYTLHVSDRQCR